MKKIHLLMLLFAVFSFSVSYGQRQIKVDEKQLKQKIEREEENKAQVQQSEKLKAQQAAEERAKTIVRGVRYEEKSRMPDPENPPVVIDIIGNRQKPQQNVKLSQFFDRIEYVRIETDPDSLIHEWGIRFCIDENHIYAYSWTSGILQYDKKGRFRQYVCKNEANYKGTPGKFVGVLEAYTVNGKLYYRYDDYPAKKKYLIAFDDKKQGQAITVEMPLIENQRTIRGKGEIIADLNPDIFGDSRQKIPYIVAPDIFALPQINKPVYEKNDFLSLISSSGDTICRFKDFEPIENYTQTLARNADNGNSYYFNGTLHLRQPFNDTIYNLEIPNRLIPKYILDFGKMSVDNAYDGVNPKYNLKDKLIPGNWLETDKHIFITYTKDYACPATAQSGALKYSRLIYDKRTSKITVIYIDEKPYMIGKSRYYAPNVNIENDIDGAFFKWPTMSTTDGKPYSIIRKWELDEIPGANLPFKDFSEKDYIIAIYH